jgi:hypothetical protein
MLPASPPGLPLLLESRAARPDLTEADIAITIALPAPDGMAFDAVTAGLMVNAQGTAPFLCVTEVLDAASGDLSLPGRIGSAPRTRPISEAAGASLTAPALFLLRRGAHFPRSPPSEPVRA